jgi:hypothetical protein
MKIDEVLSEERIEHKFRVYITDTDGSERLGATVFAKSEGHARQLATAQGVKKICSVEDLGRVQPALKDLKDLTNKVKIKQKDPHWKD